MTKKAASILAGDLKLLFQRGVNISAHLREVLGEEANTREIIELSYEVQAGSYVQAMQDPSIAKHKKKYACLVADEVLALCRPRSVLEAGVGEATTLGFLIERLGASSQYYGFDLSWSRVAYGRKWLSEMSVDGVELCTGDLLHMPYLDSSIDVVYTSHSIEPNGGREEEIIRELVRVARKYVVLLEPAYELASDEAKARMDAHGYCKSLVKTAQDLGLSVIKHELFPYSINPLNPTGITIIEKACDNEVKQVGVYCCPSTRTPLRNIRDVLYSDESLLAYPVIGGIPCLRQEHAVLASYMNEVGDA